MAPPFVAKMGRFPVIDTPYLPRQLAVLDAAFPAASSPVCILVYDTQGVALLIDHLCGRPGHYEELVDGVAWFRLSNYLPTAEGLVERITEAARTADWIFVHVGAATLPEPVSHLMKFIAGQQADTPRVVVVGEQTDVIHGDAAMQELFGSIGSFINLLPSS